jgi:hypothetical protein
MKKLATFIIITSVFLAGCATNGSSEVKKDIDSKSTEGFKASHPWILEDANVIENPEYKPGELFSSRFLIQDNLNISIALNPEYIGEWKIYGQSQVDLPAEQISAKNLFINFQKDGEILSGSEKDSNWRGIWFYDDGSVETDSGNQVMDYTKSDFWGTRWTDGWVISDTEMSRSHSIIYNGDETLLFFELKNGDYRRGYAPTYMVFKKM